MAQEHGRPVVLIELLRFASAFAVMGRHFGVDCWRSPGPRAAVLLQSGNFRYSGEQLSQFGWLGVEVFFVISGMMIARSAVGASTGEFIRRRALRLAPGAWVCATITVVVLAIATGLDRTLASNSMRSVLFWPIGEQVDPSYWTLGIEVAFYAAIAACLGPAGKERRIEQAGYGIGVVSALFWTGILVAGHRAEWLRFDRGAQLLLLPFGCLFGLGVVIARCQDAGITPRRAIAFAAFLATAWCEVTMHAIERAHSAGLPVAALTALALFAIALAALATASRAQPLLARLVNPSTARTIGLMTYPLYLVHQEVGVVVIAAAINVGLPTGVGLFGAVLTALVIAGIVARWGEPAVRRGLASGINALTSGFTSRPSPA